MVPKYGKTNSEKASGKSKNLKIKMLGLLWKHSLTVNKTELVDSAT
jgi:hypothetical protein